MNPHYISLRATGNVEIGLWQLRIWKSISASDMI